MIIEYGKLEISTKKGIQASTKVYEVSSLGASEFEEDFDLPQSDFEQKGFSNAEWQKTAIDVACEAVVAVNYRDYYKKQTNSTTNYTIFVVLEIECEDEN